MPLASRRDVVVGGLLAFALVGLNLASVAAQVGFLHAPERVKESDHLVYIAMTRAYAFGEASRAAETAPYCWRPLVPALAAGLTRAGLSVDAAYFALTNLALALFLATLFVWLRQLGFAGGLAALGVALAGLTPGAVRWYEYQYWMTDPLALFFVTLALLLLRAGAAKASSAISLLGVLARESVVLVFVFALVRDWRERGLRRATLRLIGIGAPAALALIALRLAIEPAAGGGLLETLRSSLAFRWRHLFDNQIYFATVGTFGVVLPLALLFPGRLARASLSKPEEALYVSVTYASLLLAVNTDRLLVYALPIVLPWALRSLDALAAETGLRIALPAVLALGLQVFFYLQTPFLRRAISIYQPTNLAVVASLVAFYVVAQGWIWWARRAEVTKPHSDADAAGAR
jgi:hypothetical protein